MHDAGPEDEPRDPRGKWTSSGDAPEFKRWFGESKVVDEEGNPQLLLHRSHELGLSELKAGSAGGIFFTSNLKSELYGPEKYYAYLKVEHPLDVSKGAEGGTLNEWKQALSDAGLDVENVKFDSSLFDPKASRRTYGFKNSEGQQAYNFFELIGENDYWADDGNLVKEIRRQGFDGVKSEPEDDGDTWIVFDHGQIKSTDALGKDEIRKKNVDR